MLKNMKIGAKFAVIVFLIVISSIAVTTAVSLVELKGQSVINAYNSLDQRLKTLHMMIESRGGAVRIDGGLLKIGDYVVDNRYDMVDRIKDIFGGTATIFKHDVRVSTNVLKEDGSRAIGTRLVGVARDKIFGSKQAYRGEADILGVPYFTAYDPLLDGEGNIVGVLYAGVKKEEYLVAYNNIVGRVILISVALSLIVLIAIIVYIKIMVVSPLKGVVRAAKKIADGDLTDDMSRSAKHDEIGQLISSFSAMSGNLRLILKQVKDVTDTIDYSGEQLQKAMHESATALNQQTSSITEITSTMEELNSIARQIDENSKDVTDSMNKNIAIAGESHGVMAGLLESIRTIAKKNEIYSRDVFELKEKSRRIEEVMAMIDKIADQTKLIAFNATIEAAGSGEMGKRFSIVAEEIRRLANNVMKSTGEIKLMIKEIQTVSDSILLASREETEEIKRGVNNSEQAGTAFDRVVAVSDESDRSVKNITESISQQKEATEQVLNAIRDLSEGAVLLNEKVNENLAFINTFSELSTKLKALVAQFKL